MSLYFKRAGLQTSVQDLGRVGYMHNGIARAGAMDTLAMQQANYLLGQPVEQAVLEITLSGPEIHFEQAMHIAICGATFDLKLNNKPISMNQVIDVQANDVLIFGKRTNGCRAYLACTARFELASVLGSQSTHITAGLGGFAGRALQDGDRLVCEVTNTPHTMPAGLPLARDLSGNYRLRCLLGAEFAWFSPTSVQAFLHNRWQVSPQSSRMGVRLQGDALAVGNFDMLSSGLLAGTVQVPPSGLPILAGVEAQTIGGYPRIGQIIQADMPLLAQLSPGDKVQFCYVSLPLAQGCSRPFNHQLFHRV